MKTWCANCEAVREMDVHLRCATCGSDSLDTLDRVSRMSFRQDCDMPLATDRTNDPPVMRCRSQQFSRGSEPVSREAHNLEDQVQLLAPLPGFDARTVLAKNLYAIIRELDAVNERLLRAKGV